MVITILNYEMVCFCILPRLIISYLGAKWYILVYFRALSRFLLVSRTGHLRSKPQYVLCFFIDLHIWRVFRLVTVIYYRSFKCTIDFSFYQVFNKIVTSFKMAHRICSSSLFLYPVFIFIMQDISAFLCFC